MSTNAGPLAPSAFRGLRNLSTATKLLLVLGLAVASIGGVGLMGLTGLAKLDDTIEAMHERDIAGLNAFQQSLYQFLKVRSELRGAILFIDDDERRPKLIASGERLLAAVAETAAAGEKTLVSDDDKRHYAAFRAALADYARGAPRLIEGVRGRRAADAMQAAVDMQAPAAIVDQELAGLAQSKVQLTEQARQDSRVLFHGVRDRVLLLTLLSAVILMLLGSLVARAITAPLAQVVAALRAVAEGDLSPRVNDQGTDEPGQLSAALNQALDDIGLAMARLQRNADQLAQSANDMGELSSTLGASSANAADRAGTVAHAADSVAHAAQTSASAAEQMGASIQEIARNAAESARVADDATRVATAADESIARLGVSSAEIGEVVKLISGVAEQTNLLALNATIEAARAGEMGKGFAVVATEVKQLAKQTANATDEISRRIAAIQTDSKAAVEAIGAITSIVGKVNALQSGIAAAVEEQSATTAELARGAEATAASSGSIGGAIDAVLREAQATAETASRGRGAAHTLATMAMEMKQELERFHIADQVSEEASRSRASESRGELVEWSAALATGQPLIDNQHQELFHRVRLLHEALQAGRDNGAIVGILDFLAEYTKSHFKEEEEMLEQAGYADLVAHKGLHVKLLAKVDDFRRRLRAGEHLEPADLSTFMGSWLRDHIGKVDHAYIPTLQKAGRLRAVVVSAAVASGRNGTSNGFSSMH